VKPEGFVLLPDESFILDKATNRNQKRLLMKYVRKIHANIAELENYFYDSLFIDEKGYNEAYTECLDKYHEICERFRWVRGINMDEYYFVKLFKPLENEADCI